MRDLTRIHLFVEGQTEETFVQEVLYIPFLEVGIYLNPILVSTSRTGKGGVTSYFQIQRQIERKCKQEPKAFVTTMLDLYRLPTDFPGHSNIGQFLDPYDKVSHLENTWTKEAKLKNFLPYISLHEFEALLFSAPEKFKKHFNEKAIDLLIKECKPFQSPEHINDSPLTAPSKRIKKHCSGYEKVLHGTSISLEIGLDVIRARCKHFNDWLDHLLTLKN